MTRPAPIAHVPSGTGSFLAAPDQPLYPLSHEHDRLLGTCANIGQRGRGVVFDHISTRIYIILAAITGVVILVAFAVQVMVGRQ